MHHLSLPSSKGLKEMKATSATDVLQLCEAGSSTHLCWVASLVVSEKLDPHPAPEVEEDVDGDGDGQQQAVEAHTAAAGAALREVLIHRRRVEQTKEGHYGDQSHHHRQGQHVCRWARR